MQFRAWPVCLVILGLAAAGLAQQKPTREQKVRQDKENIEALDFWIYNDIEAAFAEAKATGKPLLATIRCIPCEHCAKLDEDVAERDPRIQKLLDQFVCVRIVQANGLDLGLFQYDYDQSWAAFLMNADRVIYGRYGTRSHPTESENDVSLEGFAKALEAALELHRQYPANKDVFAAKHGPKPDLPVPEAYPTLKDKFGPKLNYEGNVVQSCMHCHQVGEAQRAVYRQRGEPLPEKVMFPYPHPKALGLVLDPKEKATVREVTSGSVAQQSGFRPGDEITALEGQPILSIADIQWVLHHAEAPTTLKAKVRRGDRTLELPIALKDGWRREGDISWRVSSWELRRICTGGLLLEEASDDQRKRAGASDTQLALNVKHVGEYGDHAAAKKAGFEKGDVIVAFDGKTDRLSEGQLFEHVVNQRRTGDRVPVTVVRGGKRIELTLPVQK